MITNPVDDFDGQAKTYTGENCRPLPVLEALDSDGNAVCVSCWKFSWDQLRHIIENDGKVYLHVYGGKQPPVYIDHKNPMSL